MNNNNNNNDRIQIRQQQQYEQQQFQQNQQYSTQNKEEQLRTKIRNSALLRRSQYTHPIFSHFKHQPINSKQCQQLRKQLISLYKPKVQIIQKQNDLQQLSSDYTKIYEQFIKMTIKNQSQEKLITQAIGQMHQMAEILMNPPNLEEKQVYLYSKKQPKEEEQQQIDSIINKRLQAYQNGQSYEENVTEEVIKKAKQYILNHYN